MRGDRPAVCQAEQARRGGRLYGAGAAMLVGRAVWGVAQTVLLGLGGNGFTMQMFIAGAFATALPGIVLQLVLIPVVMVGLEHAGVLRDTV